MQKDHKHTLKIGQSAKSASSRLHSWTHSTSFYASCIYGFEYGCLMYIKLAPSRQCSVSHGTSHVTTMN